jgi:hypothetical protein
MVATPSFVMAIEADGGGSTAGIISTPVSSGGGSTSGIISTPVADGGGSTSGSVSAPVADGGGSTAGTVSAPTADGGGSTAGTVSGGSNNGGSNNGGGTVVSGGGSATGSSGGSGNVFSSGGSSMIPLPALASMSQCNYITSYLKIGKLNPRDQVVRLQTLLRNTEGLDVDINGIFDQKTFAAVSAFQLKYAPQILAPWGIKNSTGYVYYTTQKKINEIYCKASFSLTPKQIADIEAYRTAKKAGKTPVKEEVGINTSPIVSPTPSVIPTVIVDNSTSTTDTQTANAGKTSAARRVWEVIKLIFGRQGE